MSASAIARDRAEAAQARAADPGASAWVEASAGSGKTKLLTDRVLRLLLAGVEPGRILCLTFTKAAAAEMATRLARALGAWATAEDDALGGALAKLTGWVPDAAERMAARQLFVRVLEQPGGMRISTIHAFAQSLLRAFPLEAGIAPQFGVVEEQDSRALLARERDAVLAATPDRDALEDLARLVPPARFGELVDTLAKARSRLLRAVEQRQGLPGLRNALALRLGLLPDATSEDTVLEAGCDIDAAPLNAAAAALKASRNANDRERGASINAWIAQDVPGRAARWDEWRTILLTKDGDPRKRFATKDAGAAQQSIQDTLTAEAERVAQIQNTRAAARLLAATMALLAIGTPVLRRYQAAKDRAGLLDYDDLIAGAERLLDDPGSAWVLFKIDGGLDHVLLDEAQDSNPDQWGIVRALTGEFFVGEGAREARRSVFAVGDVKQSIYAFQGADAEGFARERAHYQRAVAAAAQDFRAVPLDVSFRSTEPVLALVDAVFAEGAAREGVVEPGATLRHYADRAGQAGCVEFWPLLRAAEAPPPPPWAPPDAPVDGEGAASMLAAALATRIRHMLDHETLPARGGADGAPRRIHPSDILLLVRSRQRGGFVPALVRALKDRAIAVGGVDRMVLVDQLPVLDVLALADVLLLPEDDLALAALLKSPLIGLDEQELFDLAYPRTGGLWAALASHRGGASRLGQVADWIATLMARADYGTPHSLIADVLGAPGPFDPRSGRERMLARLGPDAADPLDELLNAALEHERGHPPSLQGFLHWLRQGAAEVKREAEGAGNAVRIMTVHGAKGLQAPIVILPDTTGEPPDRAPLRWLLDSAGALPVWAPRQEGFAAPALTDQRGADRDREAREQHRLLYVALTRAEDRLLICGWQGKKSVPEGCWYRLIEQGFSRLAGTAAEAFDPTSFSAAPDGFTPGEVMYRFATEQIGAVRDDAASAAPPARDPLPDWARRPAPSEDSGVGIAPSGLPGEAETPSARPGHASDPLGRRFRRGQLVHALLQHLPNHPPSHWPDTARRFLARRGGSLGPEEQAEALEEVLRLLAEPALAEALGPDSLAEAPLAGRIGGRLIAGQVDRLLVRHNRVMVLDYKTNRPPPAGLDEIPAIYLRQMAAYRAVLLATFPGRAVECALVWTYGARLMPLPDGLLDRHAPGAG